MPAETAQRRQRLPAEVRINQILDAALAEFSQHGFKAARMEDIAQAAHLSKGGLYAHFPSKESLLQTLLQRVVEQPLQENLHWWPQGVQTLDALVNAFVDHTIDRLMDPAFLPTIRLLLAESPRLPAGIQDWHAKMMQLHYDNHERLIQRAVSEGLLNQTPKAEDCTILMLPMMHTLLMVLASGSPITPAQLEALRPQNKMLLMRLLRT
ncbi:MAG TPA: TetR/AcrR family transcriptional regulator [Comamonas sp.]